MSKKVVSLALILVVALATLGLGYGWWTDQLNIQGTVQNGNLEVQFDNFWWTDTNCTYTSTSHEITISATNAFPSLDAFHGGAFFCEAMAQIKNTGTIPVKVMPPSVSTSGPNYWTVNSFSDPIILQPGAVSAQGVYVLFTVPSTEEGNEGATSAVTITIAAKQVEAP